MKTRYHHSCLRQRAVNSESQSRSLTQREEDDPGTLNKRFQLSEKTAALLTSVSGKPLKNTKRRQILARFPLPVECDQAYPPKLDESMGLIIPESSKKEDRLLSRLQQFSMDSLGALLSLQEQLSQEGTMDPKAVAAAVKASITLLGNAAAHFNVERRKCVMKHLNKDLQPLAKGNFPNRGPWLFGDDFGTKAKSMSDNVRALKSTLGKRKAPFYNSGGPTKKQRYTNQNPQGRRNYGGFTQPYSAGTIFQRLGLQKHYQSAKTQAPSNIISKK